MPHNIYHSGNGIKLFGTTGPVAGIGVNDSGQHVHKIEVEMLWPTVYKTTDTPSPVDDSYPGFGKKDKKAGDSKGSSPDIPRGGADHKHWMGEDEPFGGPWFIWPGTTDATDLHGHLGIYLSDISWAILSREGSVYEYAKETFLASIDNPEWYQDREVTEEARVAAYESLEGAAAEQARAESEALEAEGVFPGFNFEECGVPLPPPIPPGCPGCFLDPTATVPDWTIRKQTDPFLNERTCEYWVTVTTNSTNMDNMPGDAQAAMESGVKSLLRSHDKDDSDDISGGWEDILDLTNPNDTRLSAVQTPNIYLDTRWGTRLKILVTVPYNVLQSATDKGTVPDDENTPINPGTQVTLYSNDLIHMPKVMKKAFRKYGNQYENAVFQKLMPDVNISLKTEGINLLDFQKALIDFLKDNDFKIKSSRKIPLMEAVRVIFADDFSRVDKVEANIFGCTGVEFSDANPGKKWDKFIETDVCTQPTTLAFFTQLPLMVNDVTAREPITVDLFLKKYWYPSLEEFLNFKPGEEITLLNEDMPKDCNWKNFKPTEPLVSLGAEVAGAFLSFPELWLNSIAENTCYTLEGKSISDGKYKIEADIEKRLKDVDLRKYFSGDGFMEKLAASMGEPGDKEFNITNLGDMYKEIIDKLGWCGLFALLQAAIACIMKGLDLDTSLRALLRSFIENATSSELEGLFFRLNPGLQAALKSLALDVSDAPLPWEVGYRPGSYTGPGVKHSTDYITSAGDIPEGITTTRPVAHKSVEKTPGLGPRRFNQPSGAPGTVGLFLDAAGDALVFEPIKKAFLKAIEDEIISPDVLMDAINNMPGGALVMGFINRVQDCPAPPIFTPPLDDFLKTAEIDICEGHYSITLPVWNNIKIKNLWSGFKDIIIESAEDALEQLVMRIIMMILSKIMNWLINAPCEILADAAAVVKDVAGGASLMSALAGQLCDDATEDKVNEAVKKLFDQWKVWDPNCTNPPAEEQVADFMNGVSGILTNGEALALVKGEPDTRTLSYVMDVIASSDDRIQCAFPNTESVKAAFATIGKMISIPEVEDLLGEVIPATSPMSPTICGNSEYINTFKEARDNIYITKGLNEDERKEQINLLRCMAAQDLEDLSNVANGGIFNGLPPFVSPDPDCPQNGLVPLVDESTLQAGAEMTAGIYENITIVFLNEMMRRRGLLNMILADSRGAGLKLHTEFYIKWFGQPRASDIGAFNFFSFFVDNNDKKSDKYARELPEQVAPYLQHKLAGTDPEGESLKFDFNGQSFQYGIGLDNYKMKYDNWKGQEPKNIDLYYNHYVVATNGERKGEPIGYNTFSLRSNYQKEIIPEFNIVGERSLSSGTFSYIQSLNISDPGYLSLGAAIQADALRTSTSQTGLKTPSFAAWDVGSEAAPSPQSQAFMSIIKQKWGLYGAIAPSEDYDTELFNYIMSSSLKKLTRKVSQNARAFDYGYDASLTPAIVFLDYKEYGGTAENKPFYIDPPDYGGWLGIYESLLPPVDECGTEPVIDFKDISNIVDDYNQKFKDDPRLQSPNPSCVPEPVYNRILSAAATAGIEGMLQATIRLYVTEFMIRGMPVFSLFQAKYPDMFDETLFAYLAGKIREGLIETGRNIWGRIDLQKETYYYIFLEQIVQNFDKKVSLGEIVPTNVEQEALDRIRAVQDTWEEPPGCSNLQNIPFPRRRRAIKECREAKRDLFTQYMIVTQSDALIILNHYIADELTHVGEIFKEAVAPRIKNLPDLILGSSEWMKAGALGSSAGGLLDVPKDAFSNTDESVKAITDAFALTSMENGEYFPFVLERYIKIKDYETIPSGTVALKEYITSRDDHKKEVVNMDLWRDYLDAGNWEEKRVEDLFEKWSFGLRISFKMPAEYGGPTVVQPTTRALQESLVLGSNTYIVPVIMSEIEIPDKSKIISSEILDDFDLESATGQQILNCLVAQMVESPDYEALFKYCFPIAGLLSLVTIYVMETFLISIGQEWGDLGKYGKQGGEQFGGSQFSRWDTNDLFKRTKRILRKAFQSYYYSTDSEYKDPDEKSGSQRSREKMRIKRKFPKTKDIKRWQRKLERPKPCDT